MRKTIVAGNWKMNMNLVQAKALAEALKKAVGHNIDPAVLICPPFTAITEVALVLKDSEILIGGQNMHEADSGAFTGEVSGEMLLTSGCSHVILGHSERRILFSESDRLVNAKVKKALSVGLKPIVCVGEKLERREAGETEQVIEGHLNGSLDSLSVADMENVIIAYEPVWAIGTGKVASPEQAEEVHLFIRRYLADKYNQDIADNVTILYGGSVNATNAAGLFAKENIDGGLIGGASLKAEEFTAIVEAPS